MSNFSLFLVLGYLDLIECEVMYYITPSPSDPCLEKPCLTLSQFATNTSKYLDSNTTMIFLPGNHNLDTNLTVAKVESFMILSNSTSMVYAIFTFDTKITCKQSTMFKFNSVSHLHISGIEFIRCGGNRIESVGNFALQNSGFYGQRANRTALELVESTATIVSCFFISNSNHVGSIRSFTAIANNVGGAIIATHSNIMISKSTFEDNIAEQGGAIYSEEGSTFTIMNSTFVDNHALCQRRMTGRCNGGTIYAEGSTINSNNNHFNGNSADRDGGVMWADWSSTINSINDHFNGNSAGKDGGVMWADWSSTINSSNDPVSYTHLTLPTILRV